MDESKQVFEKDKDAQTRSSSSRPDLTLCNITEQCTEWQRQLYINDVDFDKAFSSIHQESPWHILKACGIPLELQAQSRNRQSSFGVKTGVKQRCPPMFALLFNLMIDWVMQQTTSEQPPGIRWTLFSTLEDLVRMSMHWSHTHISTHNRKPPISACLHNK